MKLKSSGISKSVPRSIFVSASGIMDHFMVMKRIDGDPLDLIWADMTAEQQASVVRQLRDIVAQLRALPPQTYLRSQVFITEVHGDFAPRNTMVRGDVVVALIDWEHSGPEQWEYCKAHFLPDRECGPSWIRALDAIMHYNYGHDLMVEKRLSNLIVGAT
ncbi:hypothetical protein DFH06DRAFT_1486453 [Mycena polygramma]|nr:hypothetical protein DFH06DRAFT_1486453 [Mycena polygramma]